MGDYVAAAKVLAKNIGNESCQAKPGAPVSPAHITSSAVPAIAATLVAIFFAFGTLANLAISATAVTTLETASLATTVAIGLVDTLRGFGAGLFFDTITTFTSSFGTGVAHTALTNSYFGSTLSGAYLIAAP